MNSSSPLYFFPFLIQLIPSLTQDYYEVYLHFLMASFLVLIFSHLSQVLCEWEAHSICWSGSCVSPFLCNSGLSSVTNTIQYLCFLLSGCYNFSFFLGCCSVLMKVLDGNSACSCQDNIVIFSTTFVRMGEGLRSQVQTHWMHV